LCVKKIISAMLAAGMLSTVYAKDVDLRILVPFPPGGGQDAVARIVATGAEKLGYSTLIENKPGAGGITGTNECIKRTATEKNLLCMVSQGQAVVVPPEIEKFVQFSFDQIQGVKLLATSPMVLITSLKNTKSYDEIINDFKTNKKLNFGSASWLNTQHNKHFLNGLKNTETQVIEYKGANQIVVDIIGGNLDYAFVPYSATSGQFTGGALRVVAVCTPRPDIVELRNVPTLNIKDGWTDVNYADFGLITSTDAKKEDVQRLEKILSDSLKDPVVKANLSKLGIAGADVSRDEYQKMLNEHKVRYARLLKK
jgi:tripartite-type tricarboxylate transporter receptor subunit TctC